MHFEDTQQELPNNLPLLDIANDNKQFLREKRDSILSPIMV